MIRGHRAAGIADANLRDGAECKLTHTLELHRACRHVGEDTGADEGGKGGLLRVNVGGMNGDGSAHGFSVKGHMIWVRLELIVMQRCGTFNVHKGSIHE